MKSNREKQLEIENQLLRKQIQLEVKEKYTLYKRIKILSDRLFDKSK